MSCASRLPARYRILLDSPTDATPMLRLVEVSTGLVLGAVELHARGKGNAVLNLIDRIAPPTWNDGDPLLPVEVDSRIWDRAAEVGAAVEDLGIELVAVRPAGDSPSSSDVHRAGRAAGTVEDAVREIVLSELARCDRNVPLRDLHKRVSISCEEMRGAGLPVKTPSFQAVCRIAQLYRSRDLAARYSLEAERRFRRFSRADVGFRTVVAPKGDRR